MLDYYKNQHCVCFHTKHKLETHTYSILLPMYQLFRKAFVSLGHLFPKLKIGVPFAPMVLSMVEILSFLFTQYFKQILQDFIIFNPW